MQGRLGKIVLVVLGVVLMLVFILPAGLPDMVGSSGNYGTLDGEDVTASDVINADNLYQYARTRIQVRGPEGRYVPLTFAIFRDYDERLADDPELFHLLLKEAEAKGALMPPEPLRERLEMLEAAVLIEDRNSPDNQRLASLDTITGERLLQDVMAAARAVLSVERSLIQYAEFPRVSQPVLDYYVALQEQQVDLRTVVFDAESFLDQVASPSQAQVSEHFEKYKENLEGNADRENPFGFGYRQPDRVRLEYVMIPGDLARRHVVRELTAMPLAEREQDLYRYWRENRAQFPAPSTRPATGPATQPAGNETPSNDPATQPAADPADAAEPAAASLGQEAPATQPATQPATGPSTQPADELAALQAEGNPEVRQFLEEQAAAIAGTPDEANWRAFMAAHDRVVQRFVDTRTSELKSNISRRVREILAADYRAFDLSRATASATTAPAARSRVGVPVDDPEYLQRLADMIREQFGVRPRVAIYNQHLDHDDLADESVVGPIAGAVSMDLQAMFPDYVLGTAVPLLEAEQRDLIERRGFGLDTFEPSRTLVDLTGSEFVFRLTEALPDAPPSDMAQVQEQVVEDLRRLAAYELAVERAQALAEEARRTSLDEAASAAGLTVHDPELFVPSAGPVDAEAFGGEADSTVMPPAERNALAEAIYGMLTDPELAEVEQPVSVLEIRPAHRAVVAELQALEGGWASEELLALRREQLREQLRQQSILLSTPAEDFFDFDRVAARIGYERERPRRDEEAEEEA